MSCMDWQHTTAKFKNLRNTYHDPHVAHLELDSVKSMLIYPYLQEQVCGGGQGSLPSRGGAVAGVSITTDIHRAPGPLRRGGPRDRS